MNKSKTKFTRPRFANNVRRRLDMDAVDDKILKSNIQKHNAAGDGPNSIEEASVKFLATKVCTESKESGDMAKFLMNFNELTIQDADSDNQICDNDAGGKFKNVGSNLSSETEREIKTMTPSVATLEENRDEDLIKFLLGDKYSVN